MTGRLDAAPKVTGRPSTRRQQLPGMVYAMSYSAPSPVARSGHGRSGGQQRARRTRCVHAI